MGMGKLEEIQLNLKEYQQKYHSMLLEFLKGDDVNLEEMFDHQQTIVRLVCHMREININETRKILQQAFTPKIEEMLKQYGDKR